MGEEEQVSQGVGATGSPKAASAASLATEKEQACSLITSYFHDFRDPWHRDYNATEVAGGESSEGKGLTHSAS